MRWLPALLTLVVVALPNATALPASPAAAGTYDPSTQILTLSWVTPPGTDPPTSWTVSVDGSIVASVSTNTWQDDLSTWSGGMRTYTVTPHFGTLVGPDSNPVNTLKLPTVGSCPPVVVAVTYPPPAVYPAIFLDCLVP